MSFHVNAGVAIDINSENAIWVLSGILGGLIYGLFTADEDHLVSGMVSCGLLGGMVMGLIGGLLMWSEIPPPDPFSTGGPRKIHIDNIN